VAAGVTFYALLAFVPALTALVSIYGLFADAQSLGQQMNMLQGVVPDEALQIIGEQLTRLAEQGETKLGLASILALAIALWSANSGMKAMFEAMNIAYDEEEKRSYILLTAVTLAFTLATIAATLVLVTLVVILPKVLELIGLGATAQWASRGGGFALMAVVLVAGLAALYRWGPSRRAAQWRWITPGAIVAIVVIFIASGLFTWYIASFGAYNATYGSLGAVFGFMTWLWIAAIITIAGAELNSEIEHQTRRDTTEGAPRPMGKRGAVMADTLGESHGAPSPHTDTEPARTSGKPALSAPRLLLLGGLVWLKRRGGRT
jgi:membrane protein